MSGFRAATVVFVLLSVAFAGCVQDPPIVDPTTAAPASSESPSASSPAASSTGPRPITGTALPALGQLAEMPGGHVSAIEYAQTDPNRLYLASDVNAMGIWRSDDAGASWRRVLSDRGEPNAHQTSLAIDPTDEDLVISADLHGKIWRTTNGGASWSIVHDNHESTELWAVAISPSHPDRVFVGAHDGSLRTSTDRGATWTVHENTFGEGVGSIAVHPEDAQKLWAGGQSGIHRSLDGGATWAKIHPSGGLPFPQLVDLSIAADGSAFLATTTLGVLRSSDGVSWSGVLTGHAHDIAWSASDPRVAYVTTIRSIQYTQDGGLTWNVRNGDLPVQDGRLAVHPTDPARSVFGNNVWQWQFHGDGAFPDLSGEGIFATTDAGKTWTPSGTGFVDLDVLTVAIDPQDPNRIYVGTECSRGLYRTEDGGASWRLISGGPQNDMWDIAHYAMQLAVAPDGRLHMTGRFGYAQTDNHGASWTSSLDRRHFHGLTVSPHDPNLVLMGTSYEHDGSQDPAYFAGNHVLRSTDGGKHWTDTSGIPVSPATTIQTFAFDPLDEDRVIVVTSSHDILEGGPDGDEAALGAYRSLDGGRTWTSLDLGGGNVQANGVTFQGGRVFIATDFGVLTSQNGGDSWTPTGLIVPTIRVLGDVADPAALYAGTWDGLYASHDAGNTWTRVPSVPPGRVSDLAMDPEGRVLVAVVNEAGVWKGIRV